MTITLRFLEHSWSNGLSVVVNMSFIFKFRTIISTYLNSKPTRSCYEDASKAFEGFKIIYTAPYLEAKEKNIHKLNSQRYIVYIHSENRSCTVVTAGIFCYLMKHKHTLFVKIKYKLLCCFSTVELVTVRINNVPHQETQRHR